MKQLFEERKFGTDFLVSFIKPLPSSWMYAVSGTHRALNMYQVIAEQLKGLFLNIIFQK